jgi:TonB-dependent receptor
VRVEETRVEGSGTFQFVSAEEKARRAAWVGPVTEEENLRRTQAEFGNRVDKSARYRNVFPGLHFRYDFGHGLQGRASYSTGIGRPSFNTIIPNDSVNETTLTVTSNNTGLKPQQGRSFDLSLEYYLNPAGLVSIGVFQKNVRDFIYTTNVGTIEPGLENGFNGEYVGYLLRTQINGSSARMRGLELNFQQQFTNLPGFWRGFGLYANCTWLQTAGNYESLAVPHSGNVGLSYIDHGWTIRVQENFVGRSVAGASATPETQQHNYGKRKLDLNVSYRIHRSLTLFADVINALNDPIGGNPFIYIPGRKRGADKFSAEVKAGLSGRF